MTTDDAAATQKAAADVLIRWVKAWGADDSDIRAFSDLQTRIAQAIRDAVAAAIRAGQVREACPCLHIEPCNPRCTCIAGGSSYGCLRCCTYGSDEQQREKAAWLAARIAAGEGSDA